MEKAPKISVIIPAYNAGRWLATAIESALEQTLKPHEIIVVDDGSTDDTPDILARFAKDKGLKPLVRLRQDNAGVSAARNLAMKHATGDWLAFLDADDFWMPRKLERVMEQARNSPDVALFSHDAFVVDEGGRRVGLYNFPASTVGPEKAARQLLLRNTIITSTTVLRADAAHEVGWFRGNLTLCEDWDYWMRVASRFRIKHIPLPLTCYRRISESAIRLNLDSTLASALRVIEDCGSAMGASEPEMLEARASAYRASAVRRLAARDLTAARRELAVARRLTGWSAADVPLVLASLLPLSLLKTVIRLKHMMDTLKARRLYRRIIRDDNDWPAGGLRVLHILMSLDTGGAERLLADALPRFPGDRYRMEVLAIGHDGPIGRMLHEGGVKVTVLNGSLSRPWFLFKFFRHLLSNKPHVIHTHLYWPGLLGRTFGRLARVEKIVCHEHFVADIMNPFRRRMEKITWKWADAVVAVSHAVLRSREGSLPESVSRYVIFNAIRLDDVGDSGSAAEARLFLGMGGDEIAAGWVGRVDERYKGLSTLLEAARLLKPKCPRLRWIMVGDGPDRGALEEKARLLDIDDTVKWIGHRPDARWLYAGFDIFVLPSRFEGLPIAIIEAMAAGLPVVATRVGGVPEIVTDGETGILVPPSNANAIAEAVLNLVENPNARRALGDAGRKRIEEQFGTDTFIENMERLYRSIWIRRRR